MEVQEKTVILLLKSAITGEKLALPQGFDMEKIYGILKRHGIVALGYLGAVQCGVDKTMPIMRKLFQEYCLSTAASERQMAAAGKICTAFDEAKIDYMPVKGCNMKSRYPQPELRSMGDADILIRLDQYDRIRPIMEKLGFTEGEESDHELIWYSKALLVELHKRLIPSYNQDYFHYYGDGWALASRAEGTHWYMTPEDEFVYIFTHFAKHYRDGGIGCRHVLDLWVFLRTFPELDFSYIERQLKQLRLVEFWASMRRLLAAWFEEGEEDDRTELMSRYIFDSGCWGQECNHILSQGLRKAGTEKSLGKGRLRWAMDVIFPSAFAIQSRYPVLKRHPVLLPLIWVRRWFEVLFRRREHLSEMVDRVQSMTDESMEAFQKSLQYVGLDFKFEE